MTEALYDEARTRKGYRARRKLIEAAAEVFAERGAEGTNVLAVCERAAIGRTSFYNYFDSIQELIDAVAAELASDFARGMDETYHGRERGVERLADCVRFILERAAHDEIWGRFVLQLDAASDDIQRVFDEGGRPDVEGCVRSGVFTLPSREIPEYLTVLRGLTLEAIRSLTARGADRSLIPRIVTLALCAGGMTRDDARGVASRKLPAAAAALTSGPWLRRDGTDPNRRRRQTPKGAPRADRRARPR